MLLVSEIKNNLEKISSSLLKRNIDVKDKLLDVLEADKARRSTQSELDSVLAESNKLAKEIGNLFKNGEAEKALQLKEKVSVKRLEKRHEHMTAACYDPNTNEISIYTKGRAFADICRSLAHEMVHQKQNELGLLEIDSG